MAVLDPLAPPTTPITPLDAPLPAAKPDPYDLTNPANKEKILSLVRDKHTQWARGGRESVVRNAWRNILFKRGHQWLVYDRGRAWWRPIDVKKYAGPRPVTNRFASTMNAFTSVLARIEPTLNFRPATAEPEDRATADVSTRVIEVCEDECNIRLQRQLLAQWVGYTGGAWLESGYDPSPEHGMRLVQHDRCLACGTEGPPQATPECATCGGPTEPAVDAQGQPVGAEQPIGKQYTEVATIFEMYFDAAETDWTRVREYLRKKSVDKGAAVRRWGDVANSITPDLGPTMGEAYQDQLPLLAGYQPEVGPGAGMLSTRSSAGGRLSEMYYWALPSDDYPEGVLAVLLGSTTVVSLGPLPYRDDRGPFLPTVYFPIDPVPGSLYSKTPADDLALKQVQRNQLEAHIMMTMNRMAWPIWLVPEGTNVSQFSGEPGQLLRYNAIGTNTAKPERIQGTGLPNGAITWLQYLDQDFEELSAAYAGTKGDRPPGVSAGISLQMIEDRKNQRFGPMYILWEHAWSRWATQQLAIFRQFATEPRLLRIQGRGSQWRVLTFLGSDLTGKVDVVAEAGSAAPRSTLVDRAEMEQMAALGLINLQDPEVQEKALALYGHSDLIPGMKADAENAAKQIETFEGLAANPQAVQLLGGLLQTAAKMLQQATASGMLAQPITYDQFVAAAERQGLKLPKIRPAVDGHPVFARELGNWLKGDASQQLPEPVQVVVEMKHAAHSMIAQQQAMQAMAMRAGTHPTSGFLSNPGGMQGANGEPPSRMQGEQREMEQNAA